MLYSAQGHGGWVGGRERKESKESNEFAWHRSARLRSGRVSQEKDANQLKFPVVLGWTRECSCGAGDDGSLPVTERRYAYRYKQRNGISVGRSMNGQAGCRSRRCCSLHGE